MSNDNLSSVLTIRYVFLYLYIVGSNRLCMYWPNCLLLFTILRLAVGSFLPCSIWSRYCVRENVCQLAEKNEIFVGKYPTFFIVWRRIQLSFSIPGRCLSAGGRLRLKCDDTRAETRFRFSAKRTNPFKSAGGVSSIDYWQLKYAHQC